MGYLSVFFSFLVSGDFPTTSILLSPFYSIVLRKLIPYGFSSLKFVDVCFMAEDMVCFGICSTGNQKGFVFSCRVECSINVNYILLVGSAVEFFCILAGCSVQLYRLLREWRWSL